MGARSVAGRVLIAAGAAMVLGVIVAAAVGGIGQYPGFSITTSKPLRFALLAAFVGWFVLLPEDREALERRLAPYRLRLLLGALAFAAVWACAFKVTRWLALRNGAYDMSLFESALLNTLDGRFVHTWALNRNLFSEHLEPVVLLLLPFYAPVKHPLAMQLPQALAVVGAAVPLYKSARALGCAPHLATFTAAAYLLNANVHHSNLMDFHPELFAPLAVFWGLHSSLTRRWVSLYAALLFALCLKEEMAVVMACFSVLVLRGEGPRRWPHALAVAAISVAWVVVAFRYVMPAADPEGMPVHPHSSRWLHLGATYPEMAWGLISQPGYVAGLFLARPPLELLFSLGGVPLLDPVSLLAAPVLLVHLSGNYEHAAKLHDYYGLFGNIFLIAALPFALARVQRRFGARAALITAMVSVAAAPTLPFLQRVTAADLHAGARIAEIAPGVKVCAQASLAPHRAPTEALTLPPACAADAEWVLLGTEHEPWPMNAAEYTAWVETQRARPELELTFAEGDYLFLRRR